MKAIKIKKFYIVKVTNILGEVGFAWIENGDPYSEGNGWFSTKAEARAAALEVLD